MANIPLGDFAQARAIPQAQESRLDMRALDNGRGAQALAQGLDDVGDVLMGIERQRQEQDAAIARAEAANKMLDDQVALDGVIDQKAQQLVTGELSWADAEKVFTETVSARPAPEIKGLREADRINYQSGLKRNAFVAQQKWQTITATHKKQYGATQVQGITQKLLTGAENPLSDPDKVIESGAGARELWVGTGNNPAEFETKFAAFKADVYDRNFAARMNTTIDNPEGLLKLRGDLANDGYWGQRLGPEKANAMIGRIDSKIDSLKADAEREARKQDKYAEQLVSEVSDQVEIGQNPGDQRLLQAAELAKTRPELAARLQDARAVGVVVERLLALPATDQRAWVASERAKLESGGGTEAQYQRIDRIDKVLKARAEARKTNPFGDPVLAPSANPLDYSNMESIGIELQARMAANDAARETNPDFGDVLLKPEEASRITDTIKRAGPEQLPALLSGLYQNAGDKAYQRVMKQVGVTDSVVAAAGIRFASDVKAGRPPTVAIGIVQGRALLTAKDKTVAMPKDADITAAFAEAYGSDVSANGAYAGRAEDYRADVRAAKAYYATLTAEAGDLSGAINPERWEQAVQAVVGTPVDIEGYRAVPPIGMAPEDFEERASMAIAEAAKRFGLNAGIFGNDFGLRNVPGKPGYYYLINADEDGAIVRDANGKTIGLDLND